ncbi:hypothetical protein ACH5RR_035967 [Cinchona calisaya]|uniref:SBP-type domain-containing protein n=1 Tax=Cinchona calisaya TaxID=153742 RepID=A0ABD2Y321_9GENT
MESLSYYLEARGPVFSEDIEFPLDLLTKNKNLDKDWDARVVSDFYKNMPSVDPETVGSMEFVETNLPNRMSKSKSLLGNPGLAASIDKMTDNASDMVPSTSMVNFDPFIWEGFGSKISTTAAEPHSQKELRINSNLEKLTDSREADSMPNSEENLISSDSSLPKRARTSNLHSQIPICQVHGCYKDLSSSKDYHKRHRVCDVHSKTAKVVINGIEKRFCQQCSRFHLLKEFDDGKRSCRKRLAGHNERRRKPQLGDHLSSGFLEMALMKRTSFLSSETVPAGFFYQEGLEKDNQSRHMKFVEGLIDNSKLAVPVANWQSPHIYLADSHTTKRPRPSIACIDTAVAVELSALPDSNGALSLLSAQSQNTSSDSVGMLIALPPTNGVNDHAYIRTDQNSAKNFGTGTLKHFAINGHSSGTINQEGIPKGLREGTFQVSEYMRSNCSSSPEVETLNLLQLSSLLQRVEQQRNSLQVKQENETFWCSSTV